MKRKPTSPGEILREEFLHPLKLSQQAFAYYIGCDVKVINRIVNEKTSVSAMMALKFAAALETTPEFWVNAQKALDIYRAKKKSGNLPKSLLKKRIEVENAA